MGAAIAAFDWGKTSLGPIEGWGAALKITVSTIINSAFPKCLCWGEDLISIYNDAFVPILGNKHFCLGQSFQTIWAEAWSEIGPISARAMAGEATFIEDFPLRLERHGHAELAHFTFCYSPVRDETGKVVGMIDTVIETTNTVKAKEAIDLRNHELMHRSRNTFALISALVSQTHRNAASLEEAHIKIQSRLSSLNKAQNILASSFDVSASIGQVVEGALEPFRQNVGAIRSGGPEIALGRGQVVSLAMAVHELATNAAKYGALSVPGGELEVRWSLCPAEADFKLHWSERGGPTVHAPERRGFGSFLIEEALPAEFEGEVTLQYLPEGFQMQLIAPLAEIERGQAAL
ncbi:HWE histidine kinase domain-containing protein [Phaeovulum sp. W22_SRMD_FR3]|uniref:HWE histidine kinase domain-containing protein n=1 Tax=Phaeovulum sp. W22_SRMD_FR3 TaxID=3240274 RepID=UPI003F9D9E1A